MVLLHWRWGCLLWMAGHSRVPGHGEGEVVGRCISGLRRAGVDGDGNGLACVGKILKKISGGMLKFC